MYYIGSDLHSTKTQYQLIMNRLIESGRDPMITRGTLEGRIIPGSCRFIL